MKNSILFALIILCQLSCTSNLPPERSNFRVISFTQGKMIEANGQWEIYEEGDVLLFEVNGQCVFSQSSQPCMWHGYILEYESSKSDIELKCTAYQNVPVNIGNPDVILKKGSRESSYTISLNGSESIFVNPQYVSIYGEDSIHIDTTCNVDGVIVLEFQQEFIFKNEANN